MKITLPLPSKSLRPNSRPHWTQRHRAVKQARMLAAALTLAEGLQETAWTHYRITYHWPTPRRRWDDDNCVAACKAYLDGICTALGIDDRTLRLSGLAHVRDQKQGVEIEIWDATASERNANGPSSGNAIGHAPGAKGQADE